MGGPGTWQGSRGPRPGTMLGITAASAVLANAQPPLIILPAWCGRRPGTGTGDQLHPAVHRGPAGSPRRMDAGTKDSDAAGLTGPQ